MAAPAAVPAPDPVLVLTDSIGHDDIPVLCERLGGLLQERPGRIVVCDAATVRAASAVTVEALARLQLTARRRGSTIRLRNADAELIGLLEFVGLTELFPAASTPGADRI